MRYNNKVETTIDGINNSNCRVVDDIMDDKYIHNNQIDAAKEIIKSFTAHVLPEDEDSARNSHVILAAKMQSGKTGTCNGVINILESEEWLRNYFKIKKYYYITGMNDTGLHDQTVLRLKQQVLNITDSKIVNGGKEIKQKPDGKFFVLKNSDLRLNKIKLENCIIFIDESHFGSNKSNVLTKFLEDNKINWKNTLELKEKNVYIVSVSATPFDEVISDIAECKVKISLETDVNYYGVSQFDDNDQLLVAKHSDFNEDKNGNIPIIEYIKEAHDKIINNNNKGVLFIRSNDKKIRNNEYIQNTFDCVPLDTSRGGSIDYGKVYDKIELMRLRPDSKPLIFFVKGAYRAGVTLESNHKDYVFLVYDNSSKPEATAQGLLGRMCGYRKNSELIKNTKFYVNKEYAQAYSDWERSGFANDVTPTQNTWVLIPNDEKIDTSDFETRLITNGIGNKEIFLSDLEIERFKLANKNSSLSNAEFCKIELKIIAPEIQFDYIGETYISGRAAYKPDTLKKWIDTNNCPSFRPNSLFKKETGRDVINPKYDLGKKIIHVALDDELNKLKIICGEISLEKKSRKIKISEHKQTS